MVELTRIDAGEVCLPGGRADALEEAPFDTARREAHEEIGLQTASKDIPGPFEVEHLCEMPANLSKNGLGVRPCIAFLSTGAQTTSMTAEDSLIPHLNAKEVAAVFSAPLKGFVRVNGPMEAGDADERLRYEGSWLSVQGKPWKAHRFYVPRKNPVEGEAENFEVWGMTARILVDAARIAYDVKPDFEYVESMGEEALLEEYAETQEIEGRHREQKKDAKLV